jgi:hypothetical protein
MEQNNYNALISLLIFVALVALFLRRWMVDALIEAINNFRGGPPTPMHPSQSNDAALLRKRFRKSED